MVKILRKNQIVFAVMGLVLITAGYLNYTYNPELKYSNEITGSIDDTLGDTIYVNALPSEEVIVDENFSKYIEYFNELKAQRNKMYDEQIDTYSDIIKSSNVSDEQKKSAQEEMKKINNLKNSVMIAENLIMLKGVKNVAIITNTRNVNVIIENEVELEKDKVAQIYAIISKEMETEINNIQIMLKK